MPGEAIRAARVSERAARGRITKARKCENTKLGSSLSFFRVFVFSRFRDLSSPSPLGSRFEREYANTWRHCERFPHQLGDCEIRNIGTEYAFRIFIAKSVWSQIVAELSEELDYHNFKEEVARFRGEDEYWKSLHEVWSDMRELQKKGRVADSKPAR